MPDTRRGDHSIRPRGLLVRRMRCRYGGSDIAA